MEWISRKVLNFLYRFRSKKTGEVKKILLLLPSSAVGDTVIETFFIHEIKKLYPQAELEVAILAAYAVLLENNSDINHIYQMPTHTVKKLLWLALMGWMFRREHYDLLLDLPHNGYAPFRQILLYFMRANKTLSCNTQGYDFITYPLQWTEEVPQHITQEVYVKALELLGAKGPFEVKYYLHLPYEKVKQARVSLVGLSTQGRKILLLNPEGSKPPRTLTPQRVKELTYLLSKQTDYKIVVLSYKQTYTDLSKDVAVFRSSDLLMTAAIISLVDYVLTVDTGILHIADAFEKPMTVLFSEANVDDSPRPYVEYIWGSKNPHTHYLKARHSVNEIEIKEICKCSQDIFC